MNELRQIFRKLPYLKIKVYPGSTLILSLLIDSQLGETLLFRPTLDDWLLDKGETISLPIAINPPYLYLYHASRVTQKVTISIPSLVKSGQILKSWLRFPATQEEAIQIQLEIVSPKGKKNQCQTIEVSLPVTLPFNSLTENLLSNNLDGTTAATFGLLSGVMDLDKIPSRWLIAEILLILAQKGEEYGQTTTGKKLLNQIEFTHYFKDGIIAFSDAQIPNWIAETLKIENSILGGHRLLEIWQKWLFSLMPKNEKKQINLRSRSEEEIFIKNQEGYADRWFSWIVLGLASISPRVANNLSNLATKEASVPKKILESDRANLATQSLITKLASLEPVTARWVVVELLLLLCQQGNEYSRTKAGSELLTKLKSTTFFESGVLAFSAAQIPRWLMISQQAASAYYTSVGNQIKGGSLLDTSEEWLWSLTPAFNEISGSSTKVENAIASLGMDAENWFSCTILGLATISPKFAKILSAIENITPPQFSHSQLKRFKDIFQEGGSLQR